MKKIVAINASPRANWNTAQLVKEAGLGAKSQNAVVKVYDLYKQENLQAVFPVSDVNCLQTWANVYEKTGLAKYWKK